ncbi:unnamed protein product, partial [Brachionus calyciflorus]
IIESQLEEIEETRQIISKYIVGKQQIPKNIIKDVIDITDENKSDVADMKNIPPKEMEASEPNELEKSGCISGTFRYVKDVDEIICIPESESEKIKDDVNESKVEDRTNESYKKSFANKQENSEIVQNIIVQYQLLETLHMNLFQHMVEKNVVKLLVQLF